MDWAESTLRSAAKRGDYGQVIRLVRESARLNQRQLGEICGLSQSAVSRMEKRGAGEYNMKMLARIAHHLGIPRLLVGLAGDGASHGTCGDGHEVERSAFIAGVAATAAAPALGAATRTGCERDDGQAAVLRIATLAYRRLDATTPARQLSETVRGHIRLVQAVAAQARNQAEHADIAAAASEAAGLVGWLSWDMADHGSARTWYGSAIKAARRADNPLLVAYQQGSLAQFEVEMGNAAQGLTLIRRARQHLGSGCPTVAAAWLSSLEAVAHATVGDEHAADRALTVSAAEAARPIEGAPPPWPWVFAFDESKVAAARVTCGARLARPRWVLTSLDDARAVLSSGHEKQRALLTLDVASGHLSSGRLDTAFALASQALDVGLKLRSGRIVERARTFRRGYSAATSPSIIRDFDSRLYDVYL